jgi:ATP-dependent Clp protease ATP-binding subunit ClpA
MYTFTARAQYVLAVAQVVAQHNHRTSITAEGVLVGLLIVHNSIATRLLTSFGRDQQALLDAWNLRRVHTRSGLEAEDAVSADVLPFLESAQKARMSETEPIATEYLLLGLLNTDSEAARFLNMQGITAEAVLKKLRIIHETGSLEASL